ncbi:hypothetical protein A0H76_895 [Hepatospora eriocheir]|nr:hypothetical protein A0H76_895 [Hepatospora eriocheir]
MVQDKKNVALEVVTGIEANSKTKYLPSIMRIYPFIDSIIPVCLLDRLVNWIFSKIVKPKND